MKQNTQWNPIKEIDSLKIEDATICDIKMLGINISPEDIDDKNFNIYDFNKSKEYVKSKRV